MDTGFAFLIVGLGARWPYSKSMSPDANTASLAADYLLWFIPAMALQFAMVVMGAALRGIGNFKPGTVVATATVILNMILAPILIFGWGTGRAFGVKGAAISTFIAVVAGIVWLAKYFIGKEAYLHFNVGNWRPQFAVWRKVLGIGLPTGFEFAVISVYLVLVYSIARPFGAAAQAGFGIGQRIIMAGFMPVAALGFAVAPVAGQNFGARRAGRVKATFKNAALMASTVMALFAVACHIAPDALVGIFTNDATAIAIGAGYLRIISWNYVASGLIFVTSSMFQAMGNTIPSLLTSAVRITIVAVPALMLARMPGFELRWIWYVSVVAVYVQLALSLLLLHREFGRRLTFEPAPA